MDVLIRGSSPMRLVVGVALALAAVFVTSCMMVETAAPRVIPSRSATFSAVMPMGTRQSFASGLGRPRIECETFNSAA